ncbi:MFS transporter [Novosphingobium sp. Leaf2]|uniref:MFS transporter n=1 Tax=Novosphingobium sp. Leaf2 TaxID=1735670 RepID=UPI0007022E7F|nr:MFS transporter [Novosphingobium sp. Leaf2]KQM14750.1 hypothetical protein ASE49_11295 [Novosphingobium sp. Leaf2]
MTEAIANIPASGPLRARSGSGRGGLVFGATLGNFIGVTGSISIPLGVLLVPIAQDLGWTRTEVAGAFTALSLAQALGYPIAGRIADRFGTRATLLSGFAALGLTLVLIGLAPVSLIAFYALFFLAGAVGVLASTMVLAKLLSQWFLARRGFWLGLVGGVGNGLAGMVMPGLAAFLAATVGWRVAFGALGVFILLAAFPILFVTLREPRQAVAQEEGAQAGATFAQAMRSPLFWAIFAAVPVGGGALTGVFASTVTVLTSQGVAVGSATLAVTLFALVCVVIEPLAGHMLDDAARPRRTAAFFALAAAGLILLAHAKGPGMAVLGSILTGMGLGVEFSVLPYLLARYFGLREMGAISGVAYAGALISNGLSPLLLNAAYDRNGSYAPGLYLVGALMVLALVVFLLLPRFDRAAQSGTSA